MSMNIVTHPLRNPYCDSGSRPSSSWLIRRFSRTLARIFPVIDSKEGPLWLSQDWRLPFLLYRCTIVASFNSWGMDPWFQKVWKSSTRFCTKVGLQALKISDGIPSDPGAFPVDSWLIACLASGSSGEHPWWYSLQKLSTLQRTNRGQTLKCELARM